MKKSTKGMPEMLGRMQWRHLAKVNHQYYEECNEKSSKCKTEMLGRIQWRHIAKVS